MYILVLDMSKLELPIFVDLLKKLSKIVGLVHKGLFLSLEHVNSVLEFSELFELLALESIEE